MYIFGSSLLCIMFVHCLIGCDRVCLSVDICINLPVYTPVFVSECMSFMGIMSCEYMLCLYVCV